jgi:hypothetical protein
LIPSSESAHETLSIDLVSSRIRLPLSRSSPRITQALPIFRVIGGSPESGRVQARGHGTFHQLDEPLHVWTDEIFRFAVSGEEGIADGGTSSFVEARIQGLGTAAISLDLRRKKKAAPYAGDPTDFPAPTTTLLSAHIVVLMSTTQADSDNSISFGGRIWGSDITVRFLEPVS